MNRKHQLSVLLIFCLTLLLVAVPAFAQDSQGSGYTPKVVQVDTSNYPEVTVYVSVVDANGNPVRNLKPEEFRLLENGQPVNATGVTQAGEQGPVTTILTIDKSGSMLKLGKLDAAKAAALAYVDLMRPEDKTGVVAFNTQVEVVQPITSDKNALKQAINSIVAVNDTALYDALMESINQLSGVQGRKVIILLSDGLDNKSRQTLNQIMQTVNQSEISIYTIGLGDPSAGLTSLNAVNEAALRQIADQSHGTYTFAPSPDALKSMYEQLSTQLQNEYKITYTSPNPLRNGLVRNLQVEIVPGGAGVVEGTTSTEGTEFGYNPGGLIPETSGTIGWMLFGGLFVVLLALLFVPDVIKRVSEGREAAPKPSRVKLSKSVPPTGKTVTPDMEPTPENKRPATANRVKLRDKKSS